MQFFLQVKDDADVNATPIREEKLYIKATFEAVTSNINVFHNDIMRIDFYIEKNGFGRPQSVSITPDTYDASCDTYGVADTITCRDFHVYCTAPDDIINVRVTGGGVFFQTVMPCYELLDSSTDTLLDLG